MYDQQLSSIITAALSRLNSELERAGSHLAGQVVSWMDAWSHPVRPEDSFRHPHSFPMLLLPWWLEQTLHANLDLAFQADLAYSTINGYYYIRLIDNLMDDHATVELKLLPALNFFHTQFQAPYQRYYGFGHHFWELFYTIWYHSAEVTMLDPSLTEMNREQFTQVAAQKTCAVKIPLAAVCCRYQRPELMAPWSYFVDLFGCWHQMQNDVFDWAKDFRRQTPTYFLAEAERRKYPAESVAEWVAREGFDWGVALIEMWMVELKSLAGVLDGPDLAAYLEEREAMMRQRVEEVSAGLQHAAKLLALLEGARAHRG